MVKTRAMKAGGTTGTTTKNVRLFYEISEWTMRFS